MLKDKKNIPIIISLVLTVGILIVGLFGIIYFKKDGLFQSQKSQTVSSSDEKKDFVFPVITPAIISEQLKHLDGLKQQSAVDYKAPSENKIKKQLEELNEIKQESDAPKLTPEIIQKQLEALNKLR